MKNDPAMALQLTQVDTFPQITNFGCFLMIYHYVLRHTGRDFFSVSSSFQSVEASVVRLYNEDQYQVNISSVTL